MTARNDIQHTAKSWSWLIGLVLISAAFLWLFLYPSQKGDGLTHRLFSAFWNLGHFGLFFIWAWLLSTVFSRCFGLRGFTLLLLCWILSLIAGFAIEDAQFNGGERSASTDDVILDVIGAFAALSIHPQCRSGLSRPIRTGLILLALGLTGYAAYPMSLLLTDTYWQWRQFPVLLDFSTPLELSRVNGSADFQLTQRKGQDSESLRITFETRRYSVFGFADLPSDWRGYQHLHIDLFNPESTALQLTCRIQDQTHDQEHTDRYNERFSIKPGVNQIEIDLQKVHTNPGGRKLDMSSIDLTLCFTSRLQRKRVLWLDGLRLSN